MCVLVCVSVCVYDCMPVKATGVFRSHASLSLSLSFSLTSVLAPCRPLSPPRLFNVFTLQSAIFRQAASFAGRCRCRCRVHNAHSSVAAVAVDAVAVAAAAAAAVGPINGKIKCERRSRASNSKYCQLKNVTAMQQLIMQPSARSHCLLCPTVPLSHSTTFPLTVPLSLLLATIKATEKLLKFTFHCIRPGDCKNRARE